MCQVCEMRFTKFLKMNCHLFIKHICLPSEDHFNTTEQLEEHNATCHPSGLQCKLCPAVTFGGSVDCFIHHSLMHRESFFSITCMCTEEIKPPLNKNFHPNCLFHAVTKNSWKMRCGANIEDYIKFAVRKQANSVWCASLKIDSVHY